MKIKVDQNQSVTNGLNWHKVTMTWPYSASRILLPTARGNNVFRSVCLSTRAEGRETPLQIEIPLNIDPPLCRETTWTEIPIEGDSHGQRPLQYWHLVVATAVVGTYPTGMHSCIICKHNNYTCGWLDYRHHYWKRTFEHFVTQWNKTFLKTKKSVWISGVRDLEALIPVDLDASRQYLD